MRGRANFAIPSSGNVHVVKLQDPNQVNAVIALAQRRGIPVKEIDAHAVPPGTTVASQAGTVQVVKGQMGWTIFAGGTLLAAGIAEGSLAGSFIGVTSVVGVAALGFGVIAAAAVTGVLIEHLIRTMNQPNGGAPEGSAPSHTT
jgi:hypothetical protein